jgi:hypothetical protein
VAAARLRPRAAHAALQRDNPDLQGSCSAATASRPGATRPRVQAPVARRHRAGDALPRRPRAPGPVRGRCGGLRAAAAADRARLACRRWHRASGRCARPPPRGGPLTDSDAVLDLLAREACAHLAPLGTSCPDHLLAHEGAAAALDLHRPASRSWRWSPGCASCTPPTATATPPTTPAHAGPTRRRCGAADPAIVLVPGVGMFSSGPPPARPGSPASLRQRRQRHAGRRAVSTYAPDRRGREVPHRVLGAGGGQAAAPARPPRPPGPAGRAGDRRPRRASARAIAERLATARAPPVVVADRDAEAPPPTPSRAGRPDVAVPVTVDVGDEAAVRAAVRGAPAAFGGVDLVVNNAGCRSPSRWPRRRPTTGTCSTASWPAGRSWSAGRRPAGHRPARAWAATSLRRVEERDRRRSQQHRLRRGQGRPGASGPAARRRARR